MALFSLSTAIALALISDGIASAQNNKLQSNAPQNNAPQSGAPQRQSKAGGAAADVARGKYLVEDVAVCGQCHTPRDSNGNLDRTRWLQGASVPYLPTKPDMDWPITAPRIGGTPPANDAEMIKLLTTGIWTDGKHLRLPMPQFRMQRGDAEAVVAYLKSVTPQR
ncbi:MAG TPA: cytochrome c [Terriglobales bacterium]|nr:cytochrome c [Terriglobales bacterium]